MSFHNGAQLNWCKKTISACNGAITGMYVVPGRPFQKQWLRNHDLEAADIPWKVGQPNAKTVAFQIVAPNVVSVDWNWYIGPGLANVVCAFWL
uniref:Ald_Xan_dh_C2 domain-containing protein n=1 Tax=Panagrellus redivivus TaxID=6233 RepID=A0A7E4VN15_PANRE